MISPHTPPGTLVVCIQELHTLEDLKPHILPEYWRRISTIDLSRAASSHQRFKVYTLAEIVPCSVTVTGFAARTEEIGIIEPLGCFRVAELPRCLTELLDVVPETVS